MKKIIKTGNSHITIDEGFYRMAKEVLKHYKSAFKILAKK